MKQYHIFLIMERLWLSIAIACAAYSVWIFNQNGWEQAKLSFLFTFIAGVLFGLRRYQRKRSEKPSGDS